MSELIHSDYELIKRDGKRYRISTRVEYRVARSEYVCKAKLYKQYGGRVRKRDRIDVKSVVTSDKDSIDDELELCIESCKDTLDEFVDATDVSVDVSIRDE
jgi:hypothetical protein